MKDIENKLKMFNPDIIDGIKEFINDKIQHEVNKAINIQKNKKDEYMTTSEVAKYLRVSRVTVWNLVKKGILIKLFIGDQPRYLKSDIDNAFVKYIPIKK